MVIFRIIFNLSRLLVSLAIRLLWLPILLVKRYFFLVILLVIAIAIYAQFDEAEQPAQLTPAAAVPEQPRTPDPRDAKAPAVLIESVSKREDGDSAFSTDLYRLMDDQQRAYYSQFFFWAMSNLRDGQSHAWANGNTNGNFTPARTFQNASGVTCRAFQETLKVRHIEQTLTGLACARPNGSWCKLKANATPACGLGGKVGFWETLKGWFR